VEPWRTTQGGGDDALLFVESIPVRRRASYVKRLLLYHWLYRRRFGQDARVLRYRQRQWPTYHRP
jgi:hypothetical protein